MSRSNAHLSTEAFLLRKTELRESDLVLVLFTKATGKVVASARGGRVSQRRFSGALEPLHTLHVELTRANTGHWYQLSSARIEQAREPLGRDLDLMAAAGRFLVWARQAAPEGTREPRLWDTLEALLDELNQTPGTRAQATLARGGLQLLAALGWALELDRCVRCARECPPTRSARVDAARGGLVCSRCGVGSLMLSASTRRRASAVVHASDALLLQEDVPSVLQMIDEAFSAHANIA